MPHPASSYAWGIKKCNTFVALFIGVGASRFKLRFEWLRGKLSSVVGSRALAKNLELLQGLEAGDTSCVMRATTRRFLCVLLLSVLVFSQSDKPRPKFSDYPVRDIYKGRPAPPVLSNDQRMFRTMIQLGAKHPVEFGGHYTVPGWGCGSGCSVFVVVDSISGKVYDGPFSVSELPLKWEEQWGDNSPARMEFHADSRLMKIAACANEQDCGFYDFVMVEGKGLKLLRKELLPSEFQY